MRITSHLRKIQNKKMNYMKTQMKTMRILMKIMVMKNKMIRMRNLMKNNLMRRQFMVKIKKK